MLILSFGFQGHGLGAIRSVLRMLLILALEIKFS